MSLLKALNVFVGDLNVLWIFVALVGKYHDLHIAARVLFNLRQPPVDAQEALFVGEVTDHNNAVSSLVVSICDCPISLLPGSVPDLQLDRRLIDLQRSESLKIWSEAKKLLYLQSQLRLCKCSSLGNSHPTAGQLVRYTYSESD